MVKRQGTFTGTYSLVVVVIVAASGLVSDGSGLGPAALARSPHSYLVRCRVVSNAN
jgi:hypothetical protein